MEILFADASKNNPTPEPTDPLSNIIPVSRTVAATGLSPPTAGVPLPLPNNINLSSTARLVESITVFYPRTVKLPPTYKLVPTCILDAVTAEAEI